MIGPERRHVSLRRPSRAVQFRDLRDAAQSRGAMLDELARHRLDEPAGGRPPAARDRGPRLHKLEQKERPPAAGERESPRRMGISLAQVPGGCWGKGAACTQAGVPRGTCPATRAADDYPRTATSRKRTMPTRRSRLLQEPPPCARPSSRAIKHLPERGAVRDEHVLRARHEPEGGSPRLLKVHGRAACASCTASRSPGLRRQAARMVKLTSAPSPRRKSSRLENGNSPPRQNGPALLFWAVLAGELQGGPKSCGVRADRGLSASRWPIVVRFGGWPGGWREPTRWAGACFSGFTVRASESRPWDGPGFREAFDEDSTCGVAGVVRPGTAANAAAMPSTTRFACENKPPPTLAAGSASAGGEKDRKHLLKGLLASMGPSEGRVDARGRPPRAGRRGFDANDGPWGRERSFS